MQTLNEKIVFALLILLALSNLVFFIISSYSGPIIGVVIAGAAAIHWWKKRDRMLIIVISVIWVSIHIYELVTMGVSSHPFLFYMNLFLPFFLLWFGLRCYFIMKRKSQWEGIKQCKGQLSWCKRESQNQVATSFCCNPPGKTLAFSLNKV